MRTIRLIPFLVLFACLMGCQAVQPWEKGNLALRHMQFDPDPVESKVIQKTFAAKEGTSGGYGVGGGGCGCN